MYNLKQFSFRSCTIYFCWVLTYPFKVEAWISFTECPTIMQFQHFSYPANYASDNFCPNLFTTETPAGYMSQAQVNKAANAFTVI